MLTSRRKLRRYAEPRIDNAKSLINAHQRSSFICCLFTIRAATIIPNPNAASIILIIGVALLYLLFVGYVCGAFINDNFQARNPAL